MKKKSRQWDICKYSTHLSRIFSHLMSIFQLPIFLWINSYIYPIFVILFLVFLPNPLNFFMDDPHGNIRIQWLALKYWTTQMFLNIFVVRYFSLDQPSQLLSVSHYRITLSLSPLVSVYSHVFHSPCFSARSWIQTNMRVIRSIVISFHALRIFHFSTFQIGRKGCVEYSY